MCNLNIFCFSKFYQLSLTRFHEGTHPEFQMFCDWTEGFDFAQFLLYVGHVPGVSKTRISSAMAENGVHMHGAAVLVSVLHTAVQFGWIWKEIIFLG